MWIVMTSCRMADRHNVAVVQLEKEYVDNGLIPKMLTKTGRGVKDSIPLGSYNKNKELDEKCALHRALVVANILAENLNRGTT